jgi:hypothetical protein
VRSEGLGKLEKNPSHRDANSRPFGLHHSAFFYLVCEAFGTATTPGLFSQPRVKVKMIMEKLMECRLAGETEILLSITKSHMT